VKKVIFLSFICVFSSVFADVRTISVAGFKANGLSQAETESISDLLALQLLNHTNFRLVDRSQLKTIFAEQTLSEAGCTDTACVRRIGTLLNINYMVSGSVNRDRESLHISAQLISIETGRIIHSCATGSFPAAQLQARLARLAQELTEANFNTFESKKLTTVSVLNFDIRGLTETLSDFCTDMLILELVQIGKWNVLDRANLKAILAEQDFQYSGCTDNACAVQLGKLLNMDYVITGSLSKIADTYYLLVKMADVSTGQIIKSYSSEASSINDLPNQIKTLAENLSDRSIRQKKTFAEKLADRRLRQSNKAALRKKTAVKIRSPAPPATIREGYRPLDKTNTVMLKVAAAHKGTKRLINRTRFRLRIFLRDGDTFNVASFSRSKNAEYILQVTLSNDQKKNQFSASLINTRTGYVSKNLYEWDWTKYGIEKPLASLGYNLWTTPPDSKTWNSYVRVTRKEPFRALSGVTTGIGLGAGASALFIGILYRRDLAAYNALQTTYNNAGKGGDFTNMRADLIAQYDKLQNYLRWYDNTRYGCLAGVGLGAVFAGLEGIHQVVIFHRRKKLYTTSRSASRLRIGPGATGMIFSYQF